MKLRNIDLSKKRKLSLREVRLPGLELRVELISLPQRKEEEPTRIDSTRPILKALAERLELQLVETTPLLDGERKYTKKEAISRIEIAVKNRSQAERTFNRMLKEGNLEELGDYYYLSDSTPF